jgi:NTE family protein
VLGAAHVGVGYALEHRNFVPDLIVGTSVGALTGGIAAAHPDRAAPWLDHVWTHLRRRDVFPLGYLSSRSSIFTDRGLRRLIARAELPSRIEQLAVPFAAVAMDLATGAPVRLDHGDLESALLASAAIPGALPPVVRDGRTLVDGRGGRRSQCRGAVDRSGQLALASNPAAQTPRCDRRQGRRTAGAPSDRDRPA